MLARGYVPYNELCTFCWRGGAGAASRSWYSLNGAVHGRSGALQDLQCINCGGVCEACPSLSALSKPSEISALHLHGFAPRFLLRVSGESLALLQYFSDWDTPGKEWCLIWLNYP
eukprot:1159770-Pelagomonas_calceolata.AAC.1